MVEYVERKGTDSIKWDALQGSFGAEDLLPLWVADMDFRIDTHITEALHDYIDKGTFGYYKVPDSYYDAFIAWEREEHGLAVDRKWMRFSPGVVTAFHIAVQVVSEPGDAVIINTPVYYPFIGAVESNGRRLICSELRNAGGRYEIDFDDFEKKIVDNDVKLYILCSPHNPVSRVWTKEELCRMLDICRRHGVTVISDEIHHDLVFNGCRHVPTLSVAEDGDKIVMLTAASKTFNLAGLQNSIVVIQNDGLRKKWNDYTSAIRLTGGNTLGYIAVEAAYRYGKPWLEEARGLIWANYRNVCDAFAEALPEVVMTPLEGTYLAWADFGRYLSPEEIQPFMQDRCGLAFDYGSWFGGDRSGSFIRINLATSGAVIEEMVRRIIYNMKK